MIERGVTDELLKLLDKKGADFMTLSAVPNTLRKRLGLPSKATAAQTEKIISPHLNEPLRFRRGTKTYIVSKPDEELLLGILKKRDGKGPTAYNTPFTKEAYAEVMNRLLEQGKVCVRLNKEHKPLLYTAKETPPIPKESSGNNISEDVFHDAFRKLERGQVFVDIYELRRNLAWPRNDFDGMLRTLRDAGKIQLHAVDATILKPDEITDSFTDENGFRMGTVTWH